MNREENDQQSDQYKQEHYEGHPVELREEFRKGNGKNQVPVGLLNRREVGPRLIIIEVLRIGNGGEGFVFRNDFVEVYFFPVQYFGRKRKDVLLQDKPFNGVCDVISLTVDEEGISPFTDFEAAEVIVQFCQGKLTER